MPLHAVKGNGCVNAFLELPLDTILLPSLRIPVSCGKPDTWCELNWYFPKQPWSKLTLSPLESMCVYSEELWFHIAFSCGFSSFPAVNLWVEALCIRLHAPVMGWVLGFLAKLVTEAPTGGWMSCCTLDPAHWLETVMFYSLYKYFYFIVSTCLLNTKLCSTSNTYILVPFLSLAENIFSKKLSAIDGIWWIMKMWLWRRKLADDSGVNYSQQTVFIWTHDNRGIYKCIDTWWIHMNISCFNRSKEMLCRKWTFPEVTLILLSVSGLGLDLCPAEGQAAWWSICSFCFNK